MANASHISIDGVVYDITPASPVSVGNGTLTIQKNGANVQTFSANQSSNATANISVPTKVSELTNDSGYTTNTGTVTQVKVGTTAYNPSSGVVNLPAYPTVNNATLTIQKNGSNVQTFTANQGSNATANITVPTKVSELTNDSGYTTNTGTVTQVKVGTTAYNPSSGVVSLPAYPSVGNGTLTIQRNGSNVATFTANQSGNSTANISVPVPNIIAVPNTPITQTCTAGVWKRLGLLTIPANTKCIVTAYVNHMVANVEVVVVLGTADANDGVYSQEIVPNNITYDAHRASVTGIFSIGNSATNIYCNVWMNNTPSMDVKLVAMTALYI